MRWAWLVLLFCNVISVGIFLYRGEAAAIYWINLLGCVVFGWFLREENIIGG